MIDIIPNFSELIATYTTKFAIYSKEYPIIAGSISIWALGLIASLRMYPQRLWSLIKKHSTTTINIASSHDIYHLFTKWFEENEFSKNSRSVKMSNGRYGESDLVKSIGYGNHLFWYKFRPISINVSQKETHSAQERDEITMTVVGRSHKFFNMIIEEAKNIKEDNDLLHINTFRDDYWESVPSQKLRLINTVYTRSEIKKELINHINQFKKNKQWYYDKCLPYQTGILLSGPPGTGKTSLIKAIASLYGYDLYILNASKLAHIERAICNLPKNCMMIIEDADSNSVTHSRELNNKENSQRVNTNNVSAPKPIFTSISDVLNAIDGIIESDDRIIIMTTNYPEKLDKALIRPGRVDLKLELGYANEEILQQFFNSFYDDFKFPEDFKIKDEISPAQIQQLILKNLNNPKKVLNELTSKGET